MLVEHERHTSRRQQRYPRRFWMVFADKYLNYRYKLGRQEGRLEGHEEGTRARA